MTRKIGDSDIYYGEECGQPCPRSHYHHPTLRGCVKRGDHVKNGDFKHTNGGCIWNHEVCIGDQKVELKKPCDCDGCRLGRELAHNVANGLLSQDTAATALLGYFYYQK